MKEENKLTTVACHSNVRISRILKIILEIIIIMENCIRAMPTAGFKVYIQRSVLFPFDIARLS